MKTAFLCQLGLTVLATSLACSGSTVKLPHADAGPSRDGGSGTGGSSASSGGAQGGKPVGGAGGAASGGSPAGGSETGGVATGGSESGGAETGGSGGATLEIPRCLLELTAACALAGACTRSEYDTCFANGVVQEWAPGDGGCGEGEMRVYRADGALCYRTVVSGVSAHGCETTYFTWYSATGTMVASGSFAGEGGFGQHAELSCFTTEEHTMCSTAAGQPGCGWTGFAGSVHTCSAGACIAPGGGTL